MDYKGFVGSAFSAQSENWESQDLANWFLQRAENPNAKTPQVLLPVPGRLFLGFFVGLFAPIRGLFSQNDRTFAVCSTKLFEIYPDNSYIERPQTVLSTMAAPTVAPSALTPAVSAPAAPTVTIEGDPGSTTYGYKVTALNDNGETEASSEGTTTVGNATLSTTNFTVVRWIPVDGATIGYKVYRTTGGGAPPRLIAFVPPDTHDIQDVGVAGTAVTPPVTNTTGGTAGVTNYGYKVTAQLGLGETDVSPEGLTITGKATLDANNYNIITWVATALATGYRIYRTTGFTTPRLIGEVDADTLTFNDTGIEGDAVTPPTSNTTGTFPIADDGTQVQFYSNGDAGNQLLIISAGEAYCFDLETAAFAKVLDGATRGGYINSYFVVLDAATSTMKASESFDSGGGFIWDPAQVYQRQSAGDKWVSIQVNNSDIWLFGSQTTDVWVPTSDPDTRFTPLPNVFVEQGTVATFSVARVLGQQIWLGQDKDGAGIVYTSDGYTPVRVSTNGVEAYIQRYENISDAYAWTYQDDGHTFYVLTFPTADRTWCYDLLTREWHRRGEYDSNTDEITADPIICHTWAFSTLGRGKHIVGGGTLATWSELTVAQAGSVGQEIVRIRRAPHLNVEHQRMKYNDFQIDLDAGQGIDGTGTLIFPAPWPPAMQPDVHPKIRVRWSDDGGQTFGNFILIDAGEIGRYKTIPLVRRCGMSRDRVFEIRVSSGVPWRLAAAYIRATPTNDLREPGRSPGA